MAKLTPYARLQKALRGPRVVVSERDKPTCGRETCDVGENPTHWVDADPTPIVDHACEHLPKVITALRRLRKLVERDYGGFDAMPEWQQAQTAEEAALKLPKECD